MPKFDFYGMLGALFMKILITGAEGFTGTVLAEHLRARGEKNIWLVSKKPTKQTRIKPCDLADTKNTARLIAKIKPDQIYQCAGSFTNNYETDYRANVITTKNILDAIIAARLKTRVLLIGSAAEYGVISPRDNPVAETHPLRPISNYGLTKTFQTRLMQYYFRKYKINAVMARAFNLYGQNISAELAAGKIYRQIKNPRRGAAHTVFIENLTAQRDYISVAAAVIQYCRIMKYGRAGEVYNVGSGRALTGKKLAEKIIRESGFKPADFKIKSTGGPVAIKTIYADIRKLNSLPKYS